MSKIGKTGSLPSDRDKRLSELRNLLLERKYRPGIIDAAIERAKNIPRTEALKKKESESRNKRPVFVITYDPRLPSITHIVQKHWRSMVKDPYLRQVFKEPPLIAYKRPKNIKEHIIRAKVPALLPPRPKRIIPGMSKCKGCPICPYIKPGKKVRATATTFTADIEQQVNCQTRNIVYCIQCKKCCIQYIGESQRTLQDRISDHRGYITKSQTNKATGEHFNLPGHKVSDMEVTILEKIWNEDPQYRKQREQMWIEKFNTKYKGLNRKS